MVLGTHYRAVVMAVCMTHMRDLEKDTSLVMGDGDAFCCGSRERVL